MIFHIDSLIGKMFGSTIETHSVLLNVAHIRTQNDVCLLLLPNPNEPNDSWNYWVLVHTVTVSMAWISPLSAELSECVCVHGVYTIFFVFFFIVQMRLVQHGTILLWIRRNLSAFKPHPKSIFFFKTIEQLSKISVL